MKNNEEEKEKNDNDNNSSVINQSTTDLEPSSSSSSPKPKPSTDLSINHTTDQINPNSNQLEPIESGFNPIQSTLTISDQQSSQETSNTSTSESNSNQSQSTLDFNQKTDLRRVKVYELQGDTWLDRGTGHCIGVFDPHSNEHQPDQISSEPEPSTSNSILPPSNPNHEVSARLEVRQEASEGSSGGQLLLRSQVLRPNSMADFWNKPKKSSSSSPSSSSSSSDEDDDDLDDDLPDDDDDLDHPSNHRGKRSARVSSGLLRPTWPEGGGIYQRQQATLVVWTEPDGTDMALSFATAQGCQEIWTFLCDVQNYLGPSNNFHLDQSSLDHAINTRGYGQSSHHRRDAVIWDDDDPSDGPPGHDHPHSGGLGSHDDDDHLSLSIDLFTHSTHPSSQSPAITTLPDPTLSNIQEIEGMIKWASRSSFGRERVSSHILRRDYVKKLEPIKTEAEDLESLKDLNALCTLVHSILMLNDAAIYEYCLQDDIVLIVAGILDYDPEFGNQKASYHSDLSDQTRFRQVIPIKDATITSKIHQTYRLQYFKDIILARILDDSTFSIINSMIFFNQIDIVQYLHSNDEFMRELFGIFDERAIPAATNSSPVIGPTLPPSMLGTTSPDVNKSPSIERKIDGILFIQQLCGMAKHLQPPSRIGFFRSLAERGVLKVIEFGLSKRPIQDDQQNQTTSTDQEDPLDDSAIKSAICEILITIIDYDPNSVRGYCLRQHEQKTRNLIECLIDLLLLETDLGLKAQLAEAVRILVDTGAGGGGMMQLQGGPDLTRREDPENENFLDFFYDHCISQLVAPIFDLPEHKNAKGHTSPIDISGIDAAMYNHLCDLLCFFVAHHNFRSKYVVLKSGFIAKLACMFIFDRYKFVQLSALRFFRSCLNKHDEYFNRCLIRHDSFMPILDLLVRQGSKDNLLSSACLEFFEAIRLKNPKPVLSHLMERDATRIKQLSEKLVTFKNLIARWEMNNEPPPPPPPPLTTAVVGSSEDTGLHPVRNIGSWSRTRTLDAEEESYFNHDSDEESDEDHRKQESQISKMAANSVRPIAIPTIPSTLVKPIGLTGSGSGSGTSGGRKRHRSGSLVSEDGSPQSRIGGLTRSQTHSGPFPSSSSSSSKSDESEIPAVASGAPLVDYADEEEETEEIEQEKPEPPKRRKNEEDEEDDGVFGRLKRGSTPMIRSSGSSGNVGFTFPTASLTSATTTTSPSSRSIGKSPASKIVLSFGKSSSTSSNSNAEN